MLCTYMHVQYNLYRLLCDSVHNVSTFSQRGHMGAFCQADLCCLGKIILLRFAVECS